MIELTESHFFSKGHHRACYRHPDDMNLCIKVVFDPSLLNRATVREEKYYQLLQKRKISWDMISKYHGKVETTMGVGTVFDLITDHNGDVSKTMSHYLNSSDLSEEDLSKMAELLEYLKQHLLDQKVITRLAPRNILFQKDATGISKIFIIDNIGNTEFIPISNYIGFLNRKKIIRDWDRFIISMIKNFPKSIELVECFNKKV